MANVGTLSIKFTGDAKQLENTFTRVGVKANLFSAAITAGLKTAAGAALDFAKSAVTLAAENESTLTSFQNLTGSLSEAKKLYKDLLDFSSKTPFSSKEIQSGATTLLGFGLSAKDATSAIKDLGAAAAANADTDLKRLVVSFGQIQGANVAMTKDLREFVNNGIPIYQILSETLGVTTSQINEMASAGQLTGDVITKAFRESAAEGGRFANTLETQSQTLNGLVSTLKDNFAIVLGKIGDTILPALKDAIKQANSALIEFQKAIDAGALNPFIAGISAVIKNIGLLAKTARDGIGPLIGVKDAIFAVSEASKGNFSNAWRLAKKAAEEYVKPLNNLADLTKNIDTITGSYAEELNKLNVATASAGDFMEDYASSSAKVVSTTNDNTESTRALRKEYELLAIAAKDFQASRGAQGIDRVQPIADKTFGAEGDTDITSDIEGQNAALEARNKQIDATQRQIEAQAQLNEVIKQSGAVASTYASKLQAAYADGAKGAKAYAQAAIETAKEVIAAQIREGVITAAAKALAKVPFPANIILAGIAGGAAEALFRSLVSKIKIPAFGDGGVVFGPTLALIGEKGPEAIVPLGRGSNLAQQRVYIAGVQYGADTYWQNANVGILGRQIYGK